MTKAARLLALNIWNNVNGDEAIDLVEKKSAINLSLAFVIAMKHYLREEYSYDYADLKDLIISIRKYSTPSSNAPLDSQTPAPPPPTLDKKKWRLVKPFKLMAYDCVTPTNIPLEILYHLQSYVMKHVFGNQLVSTPFLGQLNGGNSEFKTREDQTFLSMNS